MIVYKLTDITNGKIYVGQTKFTVEKRFKEHSHATSHIGNAIREHGAENFRLEVLETCQTREQAYELEIYYIKLFDCMIPNGYNANEGGEIKFHTKKPIFVDNSQYHTEDWLMKTSPIAYKIFKFLFTDIENYNAVYCSYKVMQERFGLSRSRVKKSINFLENSNYIKTITKGATKIYFVDKNFYLNLCGRNYDYAEFNAKVIVSSSEQDEIHQKDIQLQIKKRQEVVLKEENAV